MTHSDLRNAPKQFLVHFKAGKEAAKRGENDAAHQHFRRAIEIDPYYEQVWLWLASVVETDEDKRVCFENVLELNPSNPAARRQLGLLDQKAITEADETARRKRQQPRRRRRRLLLVLLLVVVIASAAGAAVALGLV